MKLPLNPGRLILLTAVFGVLSSCNKNDDPASPANLHIYSFAPTVAKEDDVVTITGSNFTGITAVDFGNAPAKSFEVVNASTIRAVVGSGSTGNLHLGTSNIGYFKGGFVYLPRYQATWQVGFDSLYAVWELEGDHVPQADDNPEIIKKTGASFSKSVLGNGLNLNNGYVIYDGLGPATLSSFTISFWVKSPASTGRMSSFFQITGLDFSDIWGQIQIGANTQVGYGGDTLALNVRLTQPTGDSVRTDDFSLEPRKEAAQYFGGGGKWSHVVIRYDGSTRSLDIFGNGKRLKSFTSSSAVDPSLFLLPASSQTLIGTFAFKEDGFSQSYAAAARSGYSHGITASLDDIRIFNAPLHEYQIAEITRLGLEGK